ncbi:MAG: Vitamin B12 transporter BtuB [Gemmatimonadaceae bacterium]|nr:Vitamin B12 transporter BtuB [Gemmatimonadaceae bacterium]
MRIPLLASLSLVTQVPLVLAAQNPLQGKVFDTYTRAPLAGTQVVTNAGGSAISGNDGAFSVACSTGMTVDFRLLGYEKYSATVTDCAAQLLVGLTAGTQNLNAVSIVATRDAPSVQQPLSVTTLSRSELTRGMGLFLDDVLNTVPGIRMERRTMSGGQRITIRGYGNRTNFDGSGYKAYLNGIPVTDAEGVTMLDDVDFATLGKVDVIRGPASSLYGAGIAGVVNLYTLRPDRAGATLQQETLSGADGLLRSDTRFSSVGSTSTFLMNYGHQTYDSYHVHSASKKDHVMFLGDFRPSERRNVTAFLTYAHSYDERSGQMDSAAFFGRKNVGEAPYLNNDGHVDMESVRAGVTHAYRFSERVEPVVTAYFTGVDREDVFAVGLNPRSNQTFGARAILNTRFQNGGHPVIGVTGLEYEKTNQFAKGYPYSSKVLGGITTDVETHSQQYSLFSQWEVSLPSAFKVTVGSSLNFTEYAITDRLANAANPRHRDVSGRQTYDPVLMPRFAVHRMLGDNQSVYLSWGRGFTPSTSSDAVISFTGEPNRGLKPERATQVEFGTKGSVLDNRLSYQLALFRLDVSDKLTSQSVFDNQGTQLYSYTVNAGDQANKGLELAASYAMLSEPAGILTQLRPWLSYALSDFTYSDFSSNNNNDAGTVRYDGKRVVGVPRTVWTLGADASLAAGVYLTATGEHRGDMPLTYDNAHWTPGYTVINAKAGLRRDLSPRFGIDAYAGVQNLTGELYYTMVFLNGNYSGARAPSIYLPGPYTAKPFVGLRASVRP